MPDVDAVNTGYARGLLEEYLENPEAVPSEWRALFESGNGELLEALPGLARLLENLRETNGHAVPAPQPPVVAPPPETPPDDVLLGGVAASMSLVKALRMHGHLAARLDPLGSEPVGDPALEPERLSPKLTPELQRRIPAGILRVHAPGETLADVLPKLQETYSGTSAYEIEHISDHEQRVWLREAIESGRYHRRLSALAHVIGRPYETILREFEGERTIEAVAADPEGGTGDVKYHLGAEGTRSTPGGDITVTLAANPSHLEAVDPVVEGRTRAEQTDRSTREGRHDPRVALPVLIHGDAAFPAQGIVAETLNLAELEGYSTGGTLHVIANNQIGFTTDPVDGRSTRYSSDLAKGFDFPIVPVNADDAEACIGAVRLAMAYRRRFQNDVVIDLVGYRRHGHNEQDEAAYTQPLMAARIAQQPTVREQYAAQLLEEGTLSQEDVAALEREVETKLKEAHQRLKESFAKAPVAPEGRIPSSAGAEIVTAVAAERLRELDRVLVSAPEGFTIHPKLKKQLDRRAEALDQGGIDWGQAESLAFASLLVEGIPIRLTGQDTERGTFSHRHDVLHDVETGETYTPVQHVEDAQASFELYNSPLSEAAAMGFEYGYSIAAPDALVLWEAQFGDFVNNAQGIIDQFIVAGLSKWGETSRLTLLLPHGYEGNGPEHSSARLERFLQLAAQENIRIVNCSTAAQYFHVLRRQALHPKARPLVLLTPKGLLRLKESTSKLGDLTKGSFRPILDDTALDEEGRRTAGRLVLCSGKVYYDIVGHEERKDVQGVAVARLEQLYPFPVASYDELLSRYPNITELVWAQEEPQNMGAWRAIRHRLEEGLPEDVELRYVGRPWRASPSEGYPTAHLIEQDRIARETLSVY